MGDDDGRWAGKGFGPPPPPWDDDQRSYQMGVRLVGGPELLDRYVHGPATFAMAKEALQLWVKPVNGLYPGDFRVDTANGAMLVPRNKILYHFVRAVP